MSDILSHPAKQFLMKFVDDNYDVLARLNDAIFYFGELGMQEYRSSELMCSMLEEHGFRVNLGACGFPTGFVAEYGSGSPVIAIHCEYDANPKNSQKSGVTERSEIVEGAPGHCEGHNTNGAVMTVTGIGLRYAMEKFGIPGTIKIVGAPAEETLISRPYFVRDGVFDDVDVAFHDHILDDFKSDWGHIQFAAVSADFNFKGEAAHAAVCPWDARDALDAVVLMDVGMAHYRQHFPPLTSCHRVITQGGNQPNVIPANTSCWWYFRGAFAEDAAKLFEQGKKIAQGAALMTNCEVEVHVRSAVWPVILNEVGAKIVEQHYTAIGQPQWSDWEQSFTKTMQEKIGKPVKGLATKITPAKYRPNPAPASNDSGDVSWKVPMVRVMFPGWIPGAPPHHWAAGTQLATSITHKGAAAGAKVLGTSVLEYFLDETDLIERTKAAFKEQTGGREYKSLLPEGQTPPTDLNRAEMEKYRSLMEPFYVTDIPKIAV
jgi:aminobenzoyl-glutamate utilization protein B